jgi:hypothetical protein
LVFTIALFLIGILVTRFLIPIDLATTSLIASMIFGTLVVSYVAGFIFKSSTIIKDQSDSLEAKFQDVLEKEKGFITDLKIKEPVGIEKEQEEILEPKVEEKSARQRLKDKGLL